MRTANLMDFPVEEYIQRLKKLCQKMERAQVAGILLTQEENLRYFTGLRSTAWGIKNAVPGILLMTADGEMVMVGQEHELPTMAATCCLDETDLFGFTPMPSDTSSLAKALAEAMARLGLTRGRIGIESGMVARLSMRYMDFFALQSLTDQVEYVPFSRELWEIRSIKSPREIEIYRQVCAISGHCYQKAFDSVELDHTTEQEVYHIFAQEAFRLGADGMPPLIVEFGRGRYTQANCPPSDKVITSKEHEFLFIDTGPSLKGYITDTIRMAVVGSMNARQRELRAMADEALWFCLNMIRDGVPCYEISAKMDKMVEARGFGPWNQTRGWTGHSIGLDVHEPPTLSCDCDMILRSGMILSVEPLMMDAENGMIATEHNILVTDTGYENLTPWLSDMVILQK